MKMKRIVVSAAAVLGFVASASATDRPAVPNGSADQVTKTQGGVTFRHKAYFRDRWVRTESQPTESEKPIVSILDTDERRLWVLMPPEGRCSQQSYEDDPRRPQPWTTGFAREELVGEEIVDGHPTKKYRVTASYDGRDHVSWVWRATDLAGFPLRTTDETGSWEMRYSNVELGAPDEALFQPPADCVSRGVLSGAR